jgi:hypothetical protein
VSITHADVLAFVRTQSLAVQASVQPTGAELARLKEICFARFADDPARQERAGITYIRVRPRWLGDSDYNQNPPVTVEFTF